MHGSPSVQKLCAEPLQCLPGSTECQRLCAAAGDAAGDACKYNLLSTNTAGIAAESTIVWMLTLSLLGIEFP